MAWELVHWHGHHGVGACALARPPWRGSMCTGAAIMAWELVHCGEVPQET